MIKVVRRINMLQTNRRFFHYHRSNKFQLASGSHCFIHQFLKCFSSFCHGFIKIIHCSLHTTGRRNELLAISLHLHFYTSFTGQYQYLSASHLYRQGQAVGPVWYSLFVPACLYHISKVSFSVVVVEYKIQRATPAQPVSYVPCRRYALSHSVWQWLAGRRQHWFQKENDSWNSLARSFF